MSLLLMFCGIAFGVVMFILYAGSFVLGCFGTYEERQRQAWLDSLSPEDRAAYILHVKRKKQYIKLRKKQAKICARIRQKRYDDGLKEDFWGTWDESYRAVPELASYVDVMDAPDCPSINVGMADPSDISKWRKEDQKFEEPPPWRAEKKEAATAK